jgi:helix-turn-helix protein/DnaA-like protein
MSLAALIWAENQKVGSSSAKAVLLVLAKYADVDGVCWPSQSTLAKATELSPDTVQRQSAHLEKIGALTRERRGSSRGRWCAYHYRLHLSATVSHAATRGSAITPDVAARYVAPEPQSAQFPDRTVRHKLSLESSSESSAIPSVARNHSLGGPGDRLRKRLGDDKYLAWFLDVALVEVSKDTIVLSVGRKFSKVYIENNYIDQLLDCFRPDHPKVVSIQLIVGVPDGG